MRLSDTLKRWLVSAGITVFLSVNLLGFLAIPQPANAQFDAAITSAFTAKWTWEKVESSLYSSLLASLINGASYFMRKIAYDTARYVASGGKGQGALAFQQGAGAYFAEVAGNTAAEIVDQFGKPFGLDLCKPPDLKVQTYLQVSLRRIYDQNGAGPQPNCSFQQLTSNWGNIQEQYKEQGKDIGQAFANSLRVNQGDFGIALGLAARVDRNVTQAQAGAQTDRVEGNGFKPLTNLISGEIKTPAQVIQSETESVSGKKQTELSFQQLNGIYGSGALQIIPMAASVFLNTLTSQLLDSVLSGGLFSTGGGDGSAVVDAYSSAVNRNRELAEKAFSYLIASIPTQIASYDILAQYSSCPDDGRLAGVNNCVINTQLRQALDRSLNGGLPLTIADAIKEGFLDPNAELVPPTRESDNSNKMDCISNKKYCYSNIQKMRKVRILPLGFEIAALKSDPDQPWRLGQVVAGFEDCAKTPNGVAIPDSTKPFCHLIDPNWVLKVPQAQCRTQVISEQLENETAPNRREECADISTCLAKDDKGACISYGYCTQEKNVWRLGAQSCSEQYNTCRTFVNARDNSVVSYLTRTMDYGECTQESTGCRAYSTEQVGDQWVASATANNNLKTLGRAQTMYFGDKVKNFACTPAGEGSTAFFPLLATGLKSTSPIYLKKAPDYLGCYDANPTTAVIDPAETEADLAKITPNAQCGNFAGACVASEVGCRQYKPQDGSPELTAKVGANRCDTQCIGYDTFKQEASAFDAAIFPLHFIPAQATACPAEAKYVGCSEFTNLDSAAAGGEAQEYYSSLKYCEKPATDGSNIKTYYTWEGTVSQGYVLRTHKLLPLRANDAAIISGYGLGADAAGQFVIGAPAYSPDSRVDIQGFVNKCNQTNYQLSLNDPFNANRADADCRAFYNDEGTIFYRLLAQTVTVDATCHPMRKTEVSLATDPDIASADVCSQRAGLWQNGQCQRCVGGGQYKDGACIYQTISRPGESVSCTGTTRKDQYNGCRAYTGNTIGNVQTVMSKEGMFEPASADAGALLAAKAGWSSGVVKPESIQVGQYSLNVVSGDSSISYTFASGTLKKGESYELQFWARGDANNLAVGLVQGQSMDLFTFDTVSKTPLQLSISQEWRPYRVGPVVFTGNGDAADVQLFFRREKNVQYYLDNVSMVRLTNKKTMIKNSWRVPNGGKEVPAACDSNPTDAFPGEALGCRAYTDLNTKTVTPATGFEKLCRPQAAGCSALYDSHNTLDTEKTVVFNAWCAGPEGACVLKSDVGTTLGTCVIKPGQKGCFIDRFELVTGQVLPNGAMAKSTVVVPADTVSSTPVFLTDRTEFRLTDGSQLGCQKVALENQNLPTAGSTSTSAGAYTFNQGFFRNDPALYQQILCRDDLVGCSEFRAGSEVRYARDPKLLGNKLCSYKQDLQLSGSSNKVSGWFMDGIGRCSDGNLCRADGDCGGTNKCVGIGEVACYADNVLASGEYGIWSQKTANYKGFVGQCPAEANNCTELLDPADKDEVNVKGKPYYAILDDAFRNRSAVCDGKASLKSGCVLFNQTESPNKLFDTQTTYQASIKANNQPVAPVSGSNNDSNIILKVDRDRQCSEWLSCKASMTVQDPVTGKSKTLCYQYASCRKLGPSGACEEWVTVETKPNPRLTEEVYVGRETNWQAAEYTGYSLFNKYPVSDYTYVDFEGDFKSYLAYEIPNSILEQNAEAPACIKDGKNQPDGTACGDNGGRCYQARCLYPIGGAFKNEIKTVAGIKESLNPGICKSYPEKDSPFGQGTALAKMPQGNEIKSLNMGGNSITRVEFLNKKPEFSGANICQGQNGPEACSCEYQKLSYKSGQTDYWPLDTKSALPVGICTAGERCPKGKSCPNGDISLFESTIGQPCRNSADCGMAGACTPVNRKEIRIGQRGYCMEYDYSSPMTVKQDPATGEKKRVFPCLTWFPLDTSASSFDPYNANLDAGYNPAIDGGSQSAGGELYCLETRVAGSGSTESACDKGLCKSLATATDLAAVGGDFENRNQVYDCENFKKITGDFSVHFTDEDQRYRYSVCRLIVDDDPMNPDGQGLNIANTYKDVDVVQQVKEWANKSLGSNAVVLRVEGGPLASKVNEEDAGMLWQNQKTAAGKQVNIPYALAPTNHGCRIEQGTLMHPPRVFETKVAAYEYLQKHLANPAYMSTCVESDGQNNHGITDENSYYSTVSRSPGPYMLDKYMNDKGKMGYLYRSPYEAEMNENDIEKICFVPLAFTEGKREDQPRLRLLGDDKTKTRDFCIDFARPEGDSLVGPNAVRLIGEAPNAAGFLKGGSYGVEANGMLLWSYLLESDTLSKFKYTNYSISTQTNIASNWFTDSRNEIAKRYVGVTFNGHSKDLAQNRSYVPEFARPAINAWLDKKAGATADDFVPAPTNDPFSYRYDYTELAAVGGEQLNWSDFLAIGLDFNSGGEFLGYITRWVTPYAFNLDVGNPFADHTSGYKFAVVAVLKNQCSAFAEVNTPANLTTVGANKAYTDRIWQGYNLPSLGSVKKDTPQAPYGSLALGADTYNPWSMRTYTFFEKSKDGVPYSCTGAACDHLDSVLGLGAITAGEITKPKPTGSFLNDLGQNVSGAAKALMNLFARFNKVSARQTEEVEANLAPKYDSINGGVDDSGSSKGQNAPVIYSLNPATCRGLEGVGCTAAEYDSFSINGRNYTMKDYNGDGRAEEDANFDGSPDPIIGKKNVKAVLQFFAGADDNHMPVERVKIDWNDGKVPLSSTSLYKNRKPFCEATSEQGTPTVGRCTILDNSEGGFFSPLTCRITMQNGKPVGNNSDCDANDVVGLQSTCAIPDTRLFGDLERSCRAGYFEFANDYNCSPQIAKGSAGITLAEVGANVSAEAQQKVTAMLPSGTDFATVKVCVYQPRVQVQDNWGWCNGTCKQTDGTMGYGCYDSTIPGGKKECSSPGAYNGWTGYKGHIIVLP